MGVLFGLVIGKAFVPIAVGVVYGVLLFITSTPEYWSIRFLTCLLCLLTFGGTFLVMRVFGVPADGSDRAATIEVRNESPDVIYALARSDDDRDNVLQFGDAIHSYTRRARPGESSRFRLEVPTLAGAVAVTGADRWGVTKVLCLGEPVEFVRSISGESRYGEFEVVDGVRVQKASVPADLEKVGDLKSGCWRKDTAALAWTGKRFEQRSPELVLSIRDGLLFGALLSAFGAAAGRSRRRRRTRAVVGEVLGS